MLYKFYVDGEIVFKRNILPYQTKYSSFMNNTSVVNLC